MNNFGLINEVASWMLCIGERGLQMVHALGALEWSIDIDLRNSYDKNNKAFQFFIRVSLFTFFLRESAQKDKDDWCFQK